MFAIMIRVIRVIRSLVDSVFVLKYVIEVYVSMSFCLSFVIICTGYLGDYSPPFTSLRSVTVGWGRGQLVGLAFVAHPFLFLYRVPTIIL